MYSAQWPNEVNSIDVAVLSTEVINNIDCGVVVRYSHLDSVCMEMGFFVMFYLAFHGMFCLAFRGMFHEVIHHGARVQR